MGIFCPCHQLLEICLLLLATDTTWLGPGVLPIGECVQAEKLMYTCLSAFNVIACTCLQPAAQQHICSHLLVPVLKRHCCYVELQEAKRLGMPLPAFLIVSGNRAPHLAGPQHDVDPTVMHALSYADFWPAFERRYGSNPDLVPAREQSGSST